MKDIIDLGNAVFNQLLAEHGETNESRLLFLYSITVGTEWYIIGTNKSVTVSVSGVFKNFHDPVIDSLNVEWLELVQSMDKRNNDQALARMRAKYDINLKPGDTFEFGKSSGEYRQIGFTL